MVKAVDGVSFELEPGEVLGLVGESGSGKSVTSLSIMRLIQQPPGYFAGGSIELDGVDLLKLPEREMRALRGDRVSMIFQDPMTSLNPFLTVSRQLTEVLEVHRGLGRQASRHKAIEMLERVGIPEPAVRVDQYPHELSGGMRQRVMIAMALLCEPALLLADEPTTALDVTIQAQILELIRDLVKRTKTSVVLITHDLGVVAQMADRVAVMYAGRLVETGLADEVFAKAAHPYTQGLLHSIPRVDAAAAESLVPIRGVPPDLSALPSGCPFHPRCERVKTGCDQDYPPVVELSKSAPSSGSAHRASCWDLP